ncbi:MAG: hypothetical protein VB108_02380 [Anaerolineaceae bacterium]|nr:hypothetical protein [Anaerolineaceae bacterium]
MKLIRPFAIIMIFAFLLSGCSAPIKNAQSAPSEAPISQSVNSAAKPSLAASESTPNLPSVQITPSEFFKVTVPTGHFTFLAPTDAQISVMGPHATATWDNLNLMVGIAYRAHTVEAVDPLSAVDLGILNEIGIDPGKVQVSQGDEISFSGYKTRIIKLSIEIDKAPLKGEALAIIPSDHSYLFVFGMQMLVKPGQDWEKDGKMRFQQIVRSIDFDPKTETGQFTPCDMAKEIEYGYKPEKPIKVGGASQSGHTQMEVFINNLLDPQTSAVLSIVSLDPITSGSQTLYPWEFTSKGKKSIIYIDIDNYEDPKTPIGLTCFGPLPTIELAKP